MLPTPTPGQLPNPEIEPTSLGSPTCAGGFYTPAQPGNPKGNYKGLKISVYVQLGLIVDKIQKTKKAQLPPLKSQEQKQGTAHTPTDRTTKGVGRPPQPALQQTPGPSPTRMPYKEQAVPLSGSQQARETDTCGSLWLQQGPNKATPAFLV